MGFIHCYGVYMRPVIPVGFGAGYIRHFEMIGKRPLPERRVIISVKIDDRVVVDALFDLTFREENRAVTEVLIRVVPAVAVVIISWNFR